MEKTTPVIYSHTVTNIPDHQKCMEMILEMKMRENIIAHSKTVCSVASQIATILLKKNISLNYRLIYAGALLHDITKTRALISKENHAETGADYIRKKGYPEVSELIRQHVRLDVYFKHCIPCEAEIVNYADKRVLHDKIVGLDQRMTYILEVYGKTENYKKNIKELWKITKEMEKRIFSYIDFQPDELSEYCSDILYQDIGKEDLPHAHK